MALVLDVIPEYCLEKKLKINKIHTGNNTNILHQEIFLPVKHAQCYEYAEISSKYIVFLCMSMSLGRVEWFKICCKKPTGTGFLCI